jgi:hypothetical protein
MRQREAIASLLLSMRGVPIIGSDPAGADRHRPEQCRDSQHSRKARAAHAPNLAEEVHEGIVNLAASFPLGFHARFKVPASSCEVWRQPQRPDALPRPRRLTGSPASFFFRIAISL